MNKTRLELKSCDVEELARGRGVCGSRRDSVAPRGRVWVTEVPLGMCAVRLERAAAFRRLDFLTPAKVALSATDGSAVARDCA